jgi:two-component system cell cycle sensor histidine kinase/response regulator CckA
LDLETSELGEQNRVLRERVAQLERALDEGGDPLLRSMSEHASAYLVVVDLEGRYLATGRPSEGFGSVIGRSIYDFMDPAYVSILRDVFARVVASERPITFESKGYGEDGSPDHTYITRVVPLKVRGEIKALVIVPTDITERVRLEHTLHEQRQALRLAVDACGLGIWSWNIPTGAISWDARVLQLFGLDEAPKDYAAYLAVLHEDDRERVDGIIRAAAVSGVFPMFEHRTAARPGSQERWLLSTGTFERDALGTPVRLIGGVLDITEQKQMRARLERAERVESIGQLAAGIAHNFNNLLAAILPNLELALASASDPQRQSLQVALDAALQAREVVRSMMALTQRADERTSQPADPKEVLSRVADICRITFPREITVQCSVDPDLGSVPISGGDLEQILLNLLFNARDAISAASGVGHQIEMRAARARDAGQTATIEIRVRDTGIGMSEAVRARAFEPFFTTKPPHKGSGLGLAYAADRVRDVGGSISCESTPGKGSCFTLRVPERAQLAAQAAEPAPERTAPSVKILIVDDEPMVRSIVRQLLQREGHRVIEADSAARARELLRDEGDDLGLVILDQSMPYESGIDALPSLRALTTAPIALFTGMVTSVPPGISTVLEKPARANELRRMVNDVLAKR